MASGTSPQSTKISPRKFSEKIALLNKKEQETNEKFEQIIKEVQATRSLQPNVVDATVISSKLTDELQCMSSSDHRAPNSDSLEEIERVYENLMKCVSQCDEQDSATNQETGDAQLTQLDLKTLENDLQQYDCSNSEFDLRPSSENSSENRAISSTTITTSSRNIPVMSYYPQTSDTNISINDRQLDQGVEYIPYESTSKDSFSGHSTSNMYLSSSYLPKLHQDDCVDDTNSTNACRARVVSFGSASRHRFSHAGNNSKADQQTSGIRDQSHPYQLSQYQTQYLKEPSGDRSRQKSSSDPQLHASPAQSMFPIVNSCKSDNRLEANDQIMGFEPNLQANINCCNYQQRSQNSNCKTDYICNEGAHNVIGAKSPQNLRQNHNQSSTVLHLTSSNVDCSNNKLSTTPLFNQQQCSTCNTTNNRNELPGIKICAIDDEHSLPRSIMSTNQPADVDNSSHPALETSLPDLSNLQFGNNSGGTSPDRDNYPKQWTQESSYTPLKPNSTEGLVTTSEAVNDCCQALDGSWTPYECSGQESQNMDLTADQSLPPATNQQHFDQARQSRLCWLTNSQQQQQHSQRLPCMGSNLSHSDCGFNVSSNHNQQGNLMICNSSELYNNIFRSRSHSSIDYLAKCNTAKRSQLYPNNMQQYEQHHTSRCCLENNQPVMNVRRIVELKAQGTSTSPLNSYSNLNSPQSEINSPGSSTTEQCDPTLFHMRRSEARSG